MTETRTYVGETGTTAFDGFAGLRIGKTYTGTIADDSTVLVSAVDSIAVTLKLEEWQRWFK